ncbi:MAG TPA: hypothetical protein VLC10_04685 [Patescibacteria group bacterium]|nr:hypothetical protein [Patescibacteria group bacterium]
MYAQRAVSTDLQSLLNRGRYPEMTAAAHDVVKPIFEGWRASGISAFGPEAPEPVSIPELASALEQACGRPVADVILLPDDGALPRVRAMGRQGALSPKRRLGEILQRRFGAASAALADDVRRGLHAYLGTMLKLDDQETAFAKGLEFAVRMSRRDGLYHYLCAAIAGDDRRMRALEGLVRCLRTAVPLAMIEETAGFWLAHRP